MGEECYTEAGEIRLVEKKMSVKVEEKEKIREFEE